MLAPLALRPPLQLCAILLSIPGGPKEKNAPRKSRRVTAQDSLTRRPLPIRRVMFAEHAGRRAQGAEDKRPPDETRGRGGCPAAGVRGSHERSVLTERMRHNPALSLKRLSWTRKIYGRNECAGLRGTDSVLPMISCGREIGVFYL